MFVDNDFSIQAKCHVIGTHMRYLVVAGGALPSSFIMIAAGISGRNYQRWLIHFLIASFNLFTFGAEQCQPAPVESHLLRARVRRNRKPSVC